MTDTLIARLRPLAEAAKGWGALNKVIAATDETPCQIGQMLDDEFYSLIGIDCENYDGDSLPLANFIVEASPGVVLCLLDRIEELQAECVVQSNEASKVQAENRELRAELTEEQEEAATLWKQVAAMAEREIALQSRITALEGQEPVWYYKLGKHGEHRFYDLTETQPSGCVPLFLASGAAPQQAEPKEQT